MQICCRSWVWTSRRIVIKLINKQKLVALTEDKERKSNCSVIIPITVRSWQMLTTKTQITQITIIQVTYYTQSSICSNLWWRN